MRTFFFVILNDVEQKNIQTKLPSEKEQQRKNKPEGLHEMMKKNGLLNFVLVSIGYSIQNFCNLSLILIVVLCGTVGSFVSFFRSVYS